MLCAAGLVWGSAVAACDAEPDSTPESVTEGELDDRVTWAQHVAPIVAARCEACHGDPGISFSLVGYEAFEPWGDFVSHLLEQRTMPPFPPVVDGCAPVDDPRSLPPQERDLLLQWVEDGQPLGDPDQPAQVEVPAITGDLGEPTHRFVYAGDYAGPVNVFEEYRCFRIDPQLQAPTRLRALHVDTATPDRFHFARLHVVGPDRVAELDALEGSDGRPGWPCHYNPGLTGVDPVGRLLPGLPFESLPDGTALQLEPGSQLVVDAYLHHFSYEPLDLSVVGWQASDGEPGQPSFVTAENDAFVIPAGVQSFTATAEADVGPGRLWEVDVQMHQWGRTARVEVEHADGSRSCVLNIPEWDEEWQGGYRLAAPIQTGPGDRVVATCEWANTAEDQPLVSGVRIPPDDVEWGLDALHETCTVHLTLTP